MVRVPARLAEEILAFVQRGEIPFFEDRVAAGFPSPAEGVATDGLDIVSLLIPHPESAFLYQCADDLNDAGIFSGDLLVVRTDLSPSFGSILLLHRDGEYAVRRLETDVKRTRRGEKKGTDESSLFGPDTRLCGVVRYVIHRP